MRAALAFACLLLSSCGSPLSVVGDGDVVTVDRSLAALSVVKLEVPGDLVVQEGSPASLRLEGERNLLEFIDSDVVFDELTIGVAPHVSLTPTRGLHFVLTVPSLRAIELTAPAQAHVSRLRGVDCRAVVRSVGELDLGAVEATNFELQLKSVGHAIVRGGKVHRQDVTITSSGGYLGSALESAHAHVKLHSSGGAQVWATETLDVEITSVGSVRYVGTPRVTSRITSVGTVAPLEQ